MINKSNKDIHQRFRVHFVGLDDNGNPIDENFAGGSWPTGVVPYPEKETYAEYMDRVSVVPAQKKMPIPAQGYMEKTEGSTVKPFTTITYVDPADYPA